MQTVTVKWFGPYNLERCHLCSLSNKEGLYVISRVWGGNETLVYIGRTNRELGRRIDEHNYWLQKYGGQIKIRFGQIQLTSDQRFSSKLLADIENLLIILHTTVENTSNTMTYSGRALNVINQGRRGLLKKLASWEDEV